MFSAGCSSAICVWPGNPTPPGRWAQVQPKTEIREGPGVIALLKRINPRAIWAASAQASTPRHKFSAASACSRCGYRLCNPELIMPDRIVRVLRRVCLQPGQTGSGVIQLDRGECERSLTLRHLIFRNDLEVTIPMPAPRRRSSRDPPSSLLISWCTSALPGSNRAASASSCSALSRCPREALHSRQVGTRPRRLEWALPQRSFEDLPGALVVASM